MRQAPGDVQAIDMREGKVKTFQLQIGCHEAGRAVHEHYKINLIPALFLVLVRSDLIGAVPRIAAGLL